VADVNQLKSRREYLSTIAEIQGLRQTDLRWLKMNVWKLKADGEINKSRDPITSFTDFILQSVNLMDRERSHMVPGVGDNVKIYFFDRELRQFSIQGFVYDMPYDAGQEEAGLVPFGFSVLRKLYNSSMRTSAAYRNNYIIELDYGQYNIYCTLSNMSATLTSDSPPIYVVSFVVLVEAVRLKDNVMPRTNPADIGISAQDAVRFGLTGRRDIGQPIFTDDFSGPRGILSREAAVKIGFADNLYIDPVPAPPSLTFGLEAALKETVPVLATEFPKDSRIKPKKKTDKKTTSDFVLGV